MQTEGQLVSITITDSEIVILTVDDDEGIEVEHIANIDDSLSASMLAAAAAQLATLAAKRASFYEDALPI